MKSRDPPSLPAKLVLQAMRVWLNVADGGSSEVVMVVVVVVGLIIPVRLVTVG